MIPSDLALVQACADAYTGGPWDQSWTREDIHVALRHAGEWDIIAFRGSVDAEDWRDDFRGWPTLHAELGYCHDGFLQGMETAYSELQQAVGTRPVAVTGHSLGAARALILAGLMTARNRAPNLVVTFGTPRPGMAKLSNLLLDGGYPIRHYRNGPDPVCGVPLAVPFLWPYQKPKPDIRLLAAPATESADPFRWHHIPLYVEGIKHLAGP